MPRKPRAVKARPFKIKATRAMKTPGMLKPPKQKKSKPIL